MPRSLSIGRRIAVFISSSREVRLRAASHCLMEVLISERSQDALGKGRMPIRVVLTYGH